MKRFSGIPRATVIAVMVLLAGCGAGNHPSDSGAGPGGGSIRVTANISAPQRWSDGKVYVVDGDVVVYSTLSIGPGTIVKFERDGSLSTAGSGTIIAQGTEERRIAFTSITDDARGGDTNGDGGATFPSRGDWRGISLRGANGSVFRHCDFSCSGGSVDGGKGAALDLGQTDRTVVDGCLFAGNDGGDPDDARGALRADAAGDATVVSRNVFHGNNIPLSVAPAIRVAQNNLFRDPADPSRTNRHNGIFVAGGDLAAPATWACTAVPYVVRTILRVRQTLTIGPGTVVKLPAGVFVETVNSGTIVVAGTPASRVVFTSVRDDARGGDTNGDGEASSPAPADWDGVILNGANGSVFRNCDFRYGGHNGEGALQLRRTSGTTVDGCIFADNDGDALNAAFAGAGTLVANNAFFGNAVPLKIGENVDVDGSNVFHDPANPARANRFNGISVSPCAELVAPVRWAATEVPYVVLRTLRLYDTLALSDGVVLKFQAGQGIEVRNLSGGALAGWQGAQFTSLRDDARLGDTNGDGNATVPGAGDWDGIWYESTDAGGCGYVTWPNIFYDSH